MKFELTCTCHRGRGGIPKGEQAPHEKHPCPYAALVWGTGNNPSCDCCPACTVLCLPLKTIRDADRIREKVGPEVAALYANCRLEK